MLSIASVFIGNILASTNMIKKTEQVRVGQGWEMKFNTRTKKQTFIIFTLAGNIKLPLNF